jgi:hypothetical protein
MAKKALPNIGPMPKGDARASSLPNKGKDARAEPSENPDLQTPLWSFRIIDIDSPWCWSGMDGESLKKVLSRLRNFETMTWRDIANTGSHYIDTSSIIKLANDRLVEIKQDDTDTLYSLRIEGAFRIWGIREGRVLKILWHDPEHAICPSPKKHT